MGSGRSPGPCPDQRRDAVTPCGEAVVDSGYDGYISLEFEGLEDGFLGATRGLANIGRPSRPPKRPPDRPHGRRDLPSSGTVVAAPGCGSGRNG